MVGENKKELRKRAIVLRNKMTKAEIILWSRLRMRQVEGLKFRRQQPIFDYIVDFYCHKVKLVIEVDGEIHTLPEQRKSDKLRNKMLTINGYNVIHFTNHEIETNLDSSISTIKSIISDIMSPFQGDHRGSLNEK
jgi:very-short-patch-repair endonuclease